MSTKHPSAGAKPATKKRVKHSDPIEKILARHDFTPIEMSTLGQEAGRLTAEINELKDQAKSAAADYKSRVDFKEAARNTVSGKLTNGYELRETECFVRFDTRRSKKRYFDKKTKAFVREDDMTHADWQLPMFTKKEEAAMKKPGSEAKPEAKKPAKKKPAAKTNVGDKVVEAILEAAGHQPKAEFNVDTAQSEHSVPVKFANAFVKAAQKAGWEKNVLANLKKHAMTKHEEGIGAVAEVLRPFTITD